MSADPGSGGTATPELLEGPAGGEDARRWPSPPARWTRRLTVSVAAVAVIACLGAVAVAVGRERDARRAADQVALQVTVGVQAISTVPPAGRVDYVVLVRNAGPRPIQVTRLSATAPRLSIRGVRLPARLVRPQASVAVPLSVRLDCARADAAGPRSAAVGAATGITATVVATAASGRTRAVAVRVDSAELLTDVAGTLCRLRPGLRGLELSGPVQAAG